MKKGFYARLPVFVLILLMFPVTSIFAKFWIDIKNINTGESITGSSYIVSLKTYQIEGIEFSAHFENESSDKTITCWLRRKPGSEPIPGYVDGWNDFEVRLNPGQDTVLTNVIFIRPKETGADNFTIEISRRDGTLPNDPISANRTEIIVRTGNASLNHPEILAEPQFTRGTKNSVRWVPVNGSRLQDVYYFDNADRTNLRKAVKGLLKAALSDTLSEIFSNLKNGHKYGFFAKSVYETENGDEPYYSDIVYSVQDNTPPDKVIEPQAILQRGFVSVSWNLVDDKLSGVGSYRVYRTADSGMEERLAEIDAEWLSNGQWVDSAAVGGHYFTYRIRAVDKVGNEGTGDISNSVYGEGTGDNIIIDDDNTDVTDGTGSGPFIAGSVDTIWVNLDNRERLIRFEAVRDSADYFANPPLSKVRYYDSGWVVPDSLREWGWVSTTNYDSVYFVFDYAKSANVHANDSGGLTVPVFESIDKNFVNGHIYIRRLSRRYYSTTHIESLGSIIPDCFPPDDIYNLKAYSVMQDAAVENPAQGFTSYLMYLSWENAVDDVSGLKKYHIFRKIGTDGSFSELNLPDDFKSVSYVDTLNYITLNEISNPLVSYKIVSEDKVGNTRSIDSTDWQAVDRIPGKPVLVFSTTEYPDVYPADPSEEDTIFTHEDFAELSIHNFDTSDIISWAVLVNGKQTDPYDVIKDSILIVELSDNEVSNIKVRGIYTGNRSSVWSNEKLVIRALSLPPESVSVSTDTNSYDGNIFLHWAKPCLASKNYIIKRKYPHADWSLVYTKNTDNEAVEWTDKYNTNELTGKVGDKLVAYRNYEYSVQVVNIMGDTSLSSIGNTVYCNVPPEIAGHDLPKKENGYYALTIHWRRAVPSDALNGYKTAVKVYVNNLNTVAEQGQDYVVDDTSYTYRAGVQNNNYIFRLKEIPNYPPGKMSSWSKPHIITNLDTLSLDVISQPGGSIYLNWDDPELKKKYTIKSYEVFRNGERLTLKDDSETSIMDSSKNLIHGHIYEYKVIALDSLNQKVTESVKADTADTGSVYIPEILNYSQKYFNSDSVTVSWTWRDINKQPITSSTRGAKSCSLEVSVSKNFSSDKNQTFAVGPFDVDPSITSKKVKIPSLANRINSKIYFRISAFDQFGNPQSPVLWSTDFYPVKTAVYDTVPPYPLSNISIDSVNAFNSGSDSIVVKLSWDATGVQVRGDTNNVSDTHRWNIAEYQIKRVTEDGSKDVGSVPVNSKSCLYSFSDILINKRVKWSISVIDSAGNVTAGSEVQAAHYLPTPDAPEALTLKSCILPDFPSGADSIYYFVEIATNPDYFKIAYKLNGEEMIDDSLLCRSGWIDTTAFKCISGWGEIEETDTTWFRLKQGVKQDEQWWESGWSQLSWHAKKDGGSSKPSELTQTVDVPVTFKVGQNYPNPFNSVTVIPYQLPEASRINVSVYNIAGSLVKTVENGQKGAGFHSAKWNGTNESGQSVSSGIYICVVTINDSKGKIHQSHMKLMFVK